MSRRALRLCLAAFVAGCLMVSAPQAAPVRNVLVVFANDRLLPANIEFDRGLREGLAQPDGPQIRLFAEFLDQPAFSGAEFEQAMSEYLRRKYVAQPPAVIVAGGPSALAYFLRHRELFPGTPIVHAAIGKFVLERMKPLPDGFVGSPVDYDYAATIQLAMRLHPERRHLVTVTGASPLDAQYEAELQDALGRIQPPPEVERLVGLPTKALQKRLAELGSNDLVFAPGNFVDGDGRASSPRESLAVIASASRAPVYAPFNTYLGTGLVGGMMPTFNDMGHQAARQIVQLLDGAAPSSLAQAAIAPQPQFDWRQVRSWRIDPAKLPAGAVLHYKEPSFLEAYRGQVILVAVALLGQTLLIAALLVERRRRHRAASALKQSEQRMSMAARAGGLSIWAWDLARKDKNKPNKPP